MWESRACPWGGGWCRPACPHPFKVFTIKRRSKGGSSLQESSNSRNAHFRITYRPGPTQIQSNTRICAVATSELSFFLSFFLQTCSKLPSETELTLEIIAENVPTWNYHLEYPIMFEDSRIIIYYLVTTPGKGLIHFCIHCSSIQFFLYSAMQSTHLFLIVEIEVETFEALLDLRGACSPTLLIQHQSFQLSWWLRRGTKGRDFVSAPWSSKLPKCMIQKLSTWQTSGERLAFN